MKLIAIETIGIGGPGLYVGRGDVFELTDPGEAHRLIELGAAALAPDPTAPLATPRPILDLSAESKRARDAAERAAKGGTAWPPQERRQSLPAQFEGDSSITSK